ncbi:MAG: trypsin-like peptidase domain-containing protein [Clostridia bacterium]|nr:trypsin-like peptidase domain-containing protein [Clostridia bacterium]
MKKVFFIVLASFLLIFQSANANVVVNGTDVGETINVNGTVYVPLNSIAEGFNSSVTWNGNTAYLENSSDAIVTKIVKEASEFTVGIIGKYSSGGQEGISYGSGFVIDENGIIMTNAHVVTGLKTILVVMNDGRTFEGKVKNIDANADVALVKINCTGLKAAKFADSSTLQVGQTVIAIGTPISFSLRNSATMGIISGLNRSTSNSYRLLQSDAVLNKGNSGGPLINLKAKL